MTIKGGKMTILKSGKRVWWESDLIPSKTRLFLRKHDRKLILAKKSQKLF